jgi:hypothetical protein
MGVITVERTYKKGKGYDSNIHQKCQYYTTAGFLSLDFGSGPRVEISIGELRSMVDIISECLESQGEKL